MKCGTSVTLGFGLFLLSAQLATAGPLYGTVRMEQAPAVGVEVTVACPSFDRTTHKPVPATTNDRGSYSLLVPASGRCQMRARRGDTVGRSFDVFVSDRSLRFDFEIDRRMNRVAR